MEEALQLQAEAVEADEHRCVIYSSSSTYRTCGS
jgi:hypothetical protein